MVTYLEFVASLKITLSPAQRVMCAVAFDGVDPRELSDSDRDLARQLFGDIGDVSPAVAKVIAVCKGARVGGTWLGAMRGVHLSLTVDLDHLAHGEVAKVGFTAPSKNLARQALRYALGTFQSRSDLKRLLQKTPSTDSFKVKRPDGRIIEFSTMAASARGTEQRGSWMVYFQLVEASFLRADEGGYVITDADVFKAARPRIVTGGQLVLESTPWMTDSLHWSLYTDNHGNPHTALAVEAPTELMRSDDTEILEHVRIERERDPEGAATEFDCTPLPSGSVYWFDGTTVDSCTNDSHALALPPSGGMYAAAMDAGFRRDASALVVTCKQNNRIDVVDVVELRPTKNNPLRPSEVVAEFATVMKRYGVETVYGDIHEAESLKEFLAEHDLYLGELPGGQTGKFEQYSKTRNAMREGRVTLPPHKRLLRQLRETIYRPLSGGGVQISSPRKGYGNHGDIVSAFVGAVYRADRMNTTPVRGGTLRRPQSAIWGANKPGW